MHQLISKKITIYLFLFFLLVSINNNTISNLHFPKINNLEISGINLNEREKIEKIIENLNIENIFLIDQIEIKDKIISINSVETLKIFKIYPSTLKINIKKTKFLATTKKNGQDYLIGSNGKLIENSDLISDLPFIFGDLDTGEFLKLKNKIDNSNFDFDEISNLYLYKSKRWDIETHEGNLIKLPNNDIERILNLYVRLSKEKKIANKFIIDFRQKNQIIINEK
tara:strand:+ start:2156 stop:2830 length:675 start_codon:yes stop_codon:yes gene_type:complete